MASWRTVVRGGRVISMDPQVGELPSADVLVDDDTITYIAPRIDADAEIVEAEGCVVLPGLVDTHRHTWQTLLRGRYHDSAFLPFLVDVRDRIAPRYRAHDVYLANRLGAAEALAGGVTTVVDYCHCIRTPEHADAALDGLRDAGIRAVFGYGLLSSDDTGFASPQHRLADLERVAGRCGGRVTMGVAVAEPGLVPWIEWCAQLDAARKLDALVVTHTGCVAGTPSGVAHLHRAGLLGPRQIHVHCTQLDAAEWRMLADAGAAVSLSPETELQLVGRPPIGAARAAGMAPTISSDTVAFCSGDLFAQMRLALQVQRCADNEAATEQRGRIPFELGLRTRDALAWATIDGARACGMDDRIGSLTPGKQADIVVVGGSGPHLVPRPDPVGVLVAQCRPDGVRSVLVAGRVVKRDGGLVARADLAAAQEASTRIIGDAPVPTAFPEAAFTALRASVARNLGEPAGDHSA